VGTDRKGEGEGRMEREGTLRFGLHPHIRNPDNYPALAYIQSHSDFRSLTK